MEYKSINVFKIKIRMQLKYSWDIFLKIKQNVFLV